MKVFLFLVLVLPGHPQPITHSEEMATLEECWEEAKLKMQIPTPARGSIQAGCVKVDMGSET